MIDENLLKVLSCPISHAPLRLADAETVARLNRGISAGCVQDRSGRAVEKPLEGGLMPDGGDFLYPIFNDIPVLLPDEAIDLAQLEQC